VFVLLVLNKLKNTKSQVVIKKLFTFVQNDQKSEIKK